MREGWQVLLKRHTRWRRYACGQCHHRGWTRAALPHSEHPEEQEQRMEQVLQRGRPVEARDHRAQRARRFQVGKAAALAIVLGSLLALLIGLIGRK